jgi:hypothetical protein
MVSLVVLKKSSADANRVRGAEKLREPGSETISYWQTGFTG